MSIATYEDVKNHYRVFLGRAAESDEVIQQRVGGPLAEVTAQFLASGEFLDQVFDPMRTVSSWRRGLFAGIPDRSLIEWAGQIFDLGPAELAELEITPTWHAMHSAIFRHWADERGEGITHLVDDIAGYLAGLAVAPTIVPKEILPVPITAGERRIVMVDGTYPTPDRDSGSVDAVTFVRIFRELGYQVYFIATADFRNASLDPVAQRAKADLIAMGAHVLDEHHGESVSEILRLNGGYFEISFLSRIYAGGIFFETIRTHAPRSRIIFNTVDLHGVRELRQGELERDHCMMMGAYRTLEREYYLSRLADATIVVSRSEARLLEERVPGGRVFAVPLIRDVPGSSVDLSHRSGIGFIGSYLHTPNIDAAEYFLDEIWPLVLAEVPDASFHLMGADMPDSLRDRTDRGLVVVGQVPELAPAFDKLRLSVAPLRYGAGAKGKVISSLSHGVPCVATPIAAEGMDLDGNNGILVAQTAAEMAEGIVSLCRDDALWNRLSSGGLELMRRDYSPDAGKMLISAMLTSLNLPSHIDRPAQ